MATLGGTGTGKSALVNALVGAEVVQAGLARPTTTRPTLVCHPSSRRKCWASIATPWNWSSAICRRSAGWCSWIVPIRIRREPAQAGCRAPRPGKQPGPLAGDFAPLRRAVVTATQQKYRSARVAEELAAAAPGPPIWFWCKPMPTCTPDIRDDWRQVKKKRLRCPLGQKVRAGARPRPRDAPITLTLSQRESGTPSLRIFRSIRSRELADPGRLATAGRVRRTARSAHPADGRHGRPTASAGQTSWT